MEGLSVEIFPTFVLEGDRRHIADFGWRGPSPDWVVEGRLFRQRDRLEVRSLRIRPWPGDQWPDFDDEADPVNHPGPWDESNAPGISPALMRKVPLGRIVAQAQAQVQEILRTERVWSSWQQQLAQVTEGGPGAKLGRPPLADDLLRTVAHMYLEEQMGGKGLTLRLSERLEQQLGRPVPVPTVRDWIRMARLRHYLSAAAPGRRGATAGPRLTGPENGEQQ